MIIDKLSNANTYTYISEGIKKAFDYLKQEDLVSKEVGKYEIDGDNLFVLIQEYDPKKEEEGKCEAHKKYIDIQYIISGVEKMGYAPVGGMEVIDPYNDVKDRFFVKWDGEFKTYTEGTFAIFFPQDAHMPGIEAVPNQKVKKAVVKIKV